MAAITRGTTPQITATVKGIDLTGMDVYLTIGRTGGDPWVTVSGAALSMTYDDPDTVVTATLTQAQTLACPVGHGYVQVRAVQAGYAVATGMAPVEIAAVINEDVLNG